MKLRFNESLTGSGPGDRHPRGFTARDPAGRSRRSPCHGEQGVLFEAEAGRAALLARWLELTRTVLPAMAAAHGWPIHLDHCFMRVCLDAALGPPWTAVVRRPALRHMTDAQLAAAVAVAEGVVDAPATLPALDAASIEGRRAARTAGGGGP